MNNLIGMVGNIVGFAGVLLIVAAGALRVTGHFYLAGFETMTLFVGGMGLTMVGCFAKLYVLSAGR